MKQLKERTRASGRMTEAQFTTFVKNQLRGASWKWFPTNETLKEARTRKGYYLCKGCNSEVTATIVINGKRVKNVFVDHEPPVIDPLTGFTTWDSFINRLYCEREHLQVLCKSCHDLKSASERLLAKNNKDKNELSNI